MLKTLPNILTVLRIVLALTGAYALWQSYAWSTSGLVPVWMGDPATAARGIAAFAVAAFFIAAITDWLDGWLARRLQAQSAFGALFDPIADKILVDAYLLAYLLILNHGSGTGLSPYIFVPVLAIILRDVVMTLARMTSNKPGHEALPVSASAKLKTAIAFLVTAVPLVAFPLGLGNAGWLLTAWIVALWITAALSLSTGLGYLRRKPSTHA